MKRNVAPKRSRKCARSAGRTLRTNARTRFPMVGGMGADIMYQIMPRAASRFGQGAKTRQTHPFKAGLTAR
jgi:hypothetical protein